MEAGGLHKDFSDTVDVNVGVLRVEVLSDRERRLGVDCDSTADRADDVDRRASLLRVLHGLVSPAELHESLHDLAVRVAPAVDFKRQCSVALLDEVAEVV